MPAERSGPLGFLSSFTMLSSCISVCLISCFNSRKSRFYTRCLTCRSGCRDQPLLAKPQGARPDPTMDFELSEEQRAFQATARTFASDEMMPHARDWDEGEIFPVETMRKAATLGFGGI